MRLVSITNDHTLKSRMMGNYHVRFGSGGGESDLSTNHNRLRDGEKWPGVYTAKLTLQESKQHDSELEWVYGKLLHEVYYRLDNAMQAFFRRLDALYGKELVFLDEKNTSKQCSGCGHLQAMPLYKRTYTCTECGLVLDRDENSAINILARYFARLGPHTDRMSVRCADVFTATEYV